MKKLLIVSLFLLLGACSSEATSKTVDADDYMVSLEEALKQLGDNTELKIMSDEMIEENRRSIALSEDTFIFIDVEEENVERLTLAAKPTATDLITAFTLLVGTADESLSMGDRNKLINELGLRESNLSNHTKVVNKNDIQYTFKGDSKSLLLQAEY